MKPLEPQFAVSAHCLWCGGNPPPAENPPDGPWAWVKKWMKVHEETCRQPS